LDQSIRISNSLSTELQSLANQWFVDGYTGVLLYTKCLRHLESLLLKAKHLNDVTICLAQAKDADWITQEAAVHLSEACLFYSAKKAFSEFIKKGIHDIPFTRNSTANTTSTNTASNTIRGNVVDDFSSFNLNP
jgi:hypothetical protein